MTIRTLLSTRYAPTTPSTGGGGGGGAYVSQNATYDAKYTAAFNALTISSTVYISPTGNDTTGTGTYANPWLTIDKAMTAIAANGRVILKNGTYTAGTGGFINQHASAQNLTIPAGTGSNYTIFQAETPFEVYIDQSSALYYGSTLYITSARIWLDGLSFRHDVTPQELAPFTVGDNCKVTRCRFRSRQAGTYNAVFYLGTGSLIEDCCGYGAGRYLFSTGANSADVVAGNNIFRRVVGRMDWALGDQPCATFVHYGSNSGAWVDSKNTGRQNCIAIDGPRIENRGSAGGKYGSWYDPKHSRSLFDVGNIALNDGSIYGSMRGDNIGSSTGSNTDCVVFDNSNDPGADSPNGFQQPSGTRTVTNCLAGLVLGTDFVGTTDGGGNRQADAPTNIVQRSAGSGAEILYVVGAFLTHYGEAGYNTVQTDPLWPWPYEDKMADFMDVQITLPASHYPTSPTSSRQSFTGTALDGNPMTLTRRVWEAAGTAMPDLRTVYP